jgi:hypothetical protein
MDNSLMKSRAVIFIGDSELVKQYSFIMLLFRTFGLFIS